jgi:GR25 family glycosyltransferase involved in LPS biosynthesis
MFDHVVCLNLDRRPNRWDRFQANLFQADRRLAASVARYRAVDGSKTGVPSWYPAGPGAWGCIRSHVRIWEDALTQGWESVLVFEDDALFCEDFAQRATEFLDAVPDDWDMIYLGGQHLYDHDWEAVRGRGRAMPPQMLDDRRLVLRCQNVNRTHAYAIRPAMMQRAIELCALLPQDAHTLTAYHVDNRLGTIHAAHKVYAPYRWLAGQRTADSDIAGRNPLTTRDACFWNEFAIRDPEPEAVAC